MKLILDDSKIDGAFDTLINGPDVNTDYANELMESYSERLTNYVEKYVGRNHYQTACRYLRRMKKLGGNERVNELIELFRKKYPQRKALMDELTKVATLS